MYARKMDKRCNHPKLFEKSYLAANIQRFVSLGGNVWGVCRAVDSNQQAETTLRPQHEIKVLAEFLLQISEIATHIMDPEGP
jgi:hypothetical protein